MVGLLGSLVLAATLGPRPSLAHGGSVIDSGYTNHFEWLVTMDPYPIQTGQAMVTLLVYDLTTYEPMNNLRQVTLYMAAPGTQRPCCNPTELSAPIRLRIDPQLYPGDYSELITFAQPGDWALQFVVEDGERSFAVVVPMMVVPAQPGQSWSPALEGPDVAATATAFAQNVQQARQQNSPLAGMLSPLVPSPLAADALALTVNTGGTFTFLGLSWWLWGVAALIPIGMGWLLLRSPQAKQEDEGADEVETPEGE
ncbi:MAG: hypothetical protein KF832_10800 [Caldilineaceae bacterium]|nr:hypothetical protein [Caldilineaceae bacterium]